LLLKGLQFLFHSSLDLFFLLPSPLILCFFLGSLCRRYDINFSDS
jgi:hypothetical protein